MDSKQSAFERLVSSKPRTVNWATAETPKDARLQRVQEVLFSLDPHTARAVIDLLQIAEERNHELFAAREQIEALRKRVDELEKPPATVVRRSWLSRLIRR